MRKLTVGLIGNPNCGKTTLFNALTGSRQRVGNWPGVTVERKSGSFTKGDCSVEIVDLPGIYSLSVFSETGSLDERIAAEYVISDQADLFINVIDANNLERNLYLTTQLLELDVPVVVALNMVDIVKRHGVTIDSRELSARLGCSVVSLVSNRNQGIAELKTAVIAAIQPDAAEDKLVRDDLSGFRGHRDKFINYNSLVSVALSQLTQRITTESTASRHSYFLAVRLLEDDILASKQLAPSILEFVRTKQQAIAAKLNDDVDVLIADARYGAIHELVALVQMRHVTARKTISSFIDRIVLNRVLGIPIFLLAMYLMFLFTIGVGGRLQALFQWGSDAIFVHGLNSLLTTMHTPAWLVVALTSGVGKGIGTTLTFIPVIAALFLVLALLEDTGYMARAGFVIDRLMQAIGLPGKSFVPMLVGFGCNVPAVMAARTLRNNHERILTIMMTPFMSCGARLAVYSIFVAAFFPRGGQNIVFALYVIGILMAVFSGLLFGKTLLRGEKTSLVTELPPYHLPTVRDVCLQAWCRLRNFILKAGKIIVPVCLLMSMLNAVNIDGAINSNYPSNNSLLAVAGQKITPIFKPMGITKDNWQATVGLITGVVAKEVVVGSLNTLYAAPGKAHELYGNMYKKFGGGLAAFAYLLFVLLYFPCVPTLITIYRELNWRWALFSMLWNTGVAYGAATLFYQLARMFF